MPATVQVPVIKTDGWTPTKFKWIIVKNRQYGELRKWPGYENFSDLDQVEKDVLNVKKGF